MIVYIPYSITDDRTRNLNTISELGFGYNFGMNSFQSTCLMTEYTTTSSYDYDRKCLSFIYHSLDTCTSYILTNLTINLIIFETHYLI